MAYNKVVLLGNLTRDPETRAAGAGQVTSFSIAVNDTWVDKNGSKQERTNFIDCECWGPRGETIAKYFTKGRQILVEGSLKQDTWEDKDTGKNRSKLVVSVNGFSFVNDGKGGGSGSSQSAPTGNENPVVNVPEDGEVDLTDIPF